MVMHRFPSLIPGIDSVYYENPEKAELVISKLEEETELREAAEVKRLEAEEISNEENK